MRILLSWLKEMVPVESSPEELADLLASKGAEVEKIERPWDGLDGVVVAEVIEIRDHPGSDKLCIARIRVDAAEREVVVGVRNMKAGDLVPYAPPGSRVPAVPEPLAAKEIRGVVSEGMLCSHRELAIADVHTEILVLPPGSRGGADFKTEFGLDDAVLEIEVTPNRPDFMSVVGIAREVAAATGLPLTLPDSAVAESAGRAEDLIAVEIEDLVRCPRYLARVVTGVEISPSPVKVQARLTASGMRPISSVVDATNYALIELGHPLHPFDLRLVSGKAIIVRPAREGESVTTLDGIERRMSGEDLLIADGEKAVAIGGIMGAVSAEVSGGTKDVLLESAYFERSGIMRSARRLELSTEASKRFERGADPEVVPVAAGRAARLIADWSGGTVLSGQADVGETPARRHVAVRPSRASLLLGYEVTEQAALDAFASLGMPAEKSDGSVDVEVPGYRVDIEREADLIEEIVRVQGYGKVGSSLPAVRQSGAYPSEYALRRRIREILVRAGFREVRPAPFVPRSDIDLFGDEDAVAVSNPLAAEEAWLRTRLTPGLLRVLARNHARAARGAAVFEIGNVFRRGDPVEERRKVGIAVSGDAGSVWTEPSRDFDFFDAKGAVEALMDGLGIRSWELGAAPGHPFHSGRSAEVLIDGDHAGVMGEIDASVAAKFDLDRRAAVAVLGVGALARAANGDITYLDVSRFPPVRRDLAFNVPADVSQGEIRRALGELAGDLADEVVLFDVFSGPPVPEGYRSMAFSIGLRAPDRTLTDAEADEVVNRVKDGLAADFGAELRAG